MGLLFVFLTILFTVYGQLIIKWQVIQAGPFPTNNLDKLIFLLHLLLNPWIISAFIAAFIAALSWIAAMSKLELSYAYPFMSLSFVLVILLSSLFLHESLSLVKIISVGLIICGVVLLGYN